MEDIYTTDLKRMEDSNMNQLHNMLSMDESVNLIQAHFNLTRSEVAMILGISRQWLHYNMTERMSKRVRLDLTAFILDSYNNWNNEMYWQEVLTTYRGNIAE